MNPDVNLSDYLSEVRRGLAVYKDRVASAKAQTPDFAFFFNATRYSWLAIICIIALAFLTSGWSSGRARVKA